MLIKKKWSTDSRPPKEALGLVGGLADGMSRWISPQDWRPA